MSQIARLTRDFARRKQQTTLMKGTQDLPELREGGLGQMPAPEDNAAPLSQEEQEIQNLRVDIAKLRGGIAKEIRAMEKPGLDSRMKSVTTITG